MSPIIVPVTKASKFGLSCNGDTFDGPHRRKALARTINRVAKIAKQDPKLALGRTDRFKACAHHMRWFDSFSAAQFYVSDAMTGLISFGIHQCFTSHSGLDEPI
jgi:hypothetical protein